MDPQFWLETWEAERIGFHLDRVHPLLERHWPGLGLTADDPVLVPLCGKSLDLVHLRRLGHSVLGVELSPLAVRQFFEEQEKTPTATEAEGLSVLEADGIRLIQGDFFALRADAAGSCAGAYDRAALIAMPPARQADYVRQLLDLLEPGAPILLITLDYDPVEMDGPPFATSAARVRELFAGRYEPEILATAEVIADNPGLAARGLTALTETAWRLRPMAGAPGR